MFNGTLKIMFIIELEMFKNLIVLVILLSNKFKFPNSKFDLQDNFVNNLKTRMLAVL